MKQVIATLKPGRDRPIRAGHPWVFAGAVAAWSRTPVAGDVVDVAGPDGAWLGRGLAETGGGLAIRIYTRDEATAVDEGLFVSLLERALSRRERDVFPSEPDTDSFRLVFSEADGLSGLIVDRYADAISVQTSSPALAPYVPAMTGLLKARGWAPAEGARIRESGFQYDVDLSAGQKTGFYLDQRINRRRAAAYAKDRTCLSAYCYTGAFEIHLAAAGAKSVTGIDSSEPAIERARANGALNGIAADYLTADVPSQLRKFRDSRTTFDLIVLDPPKFVANRHQLEKGLRAYKDINLLAMKLLTPGGILVTFSCSGWVKADSFQTALEWAALDAGRPVQILERLGQPPDHPTLLGFPESDYLCGAILRVE